MTTRRQAQGGLVQHEQLGVGHERPGHGEHLLLAAGKGPAALEQAFLEAGNRE